jgi:hypothetical protein
MLQVGIVVSATTDVAVANATKSADVRTIMYIIKADC